MTFAPINIFQRLMRHWDTVHPYNAAQVLEIVGDLDAAGAIEAWNAGWKTAVISTGLGPIQSTSRAYRFAPATDDHLRVPKVDRCWDVHVSAELDRPFVAPNELPLRPFLAPAGSGRFAVGLIYQHWIADSAAIRMLMREWFTAAVDPTARNGRPLRLASHGYWNTVGPGRRNHGVGETIANAIRRQTRLRRAQKISSHNLRDYRTAFMRVESQPGLVTGLKTYARRHGISVNDILMAALAEACWLHVPLQARPSRREVAVGSIVDLRSASVEDVSDVFGLFLGFTNAICQPKELTDFEQLVKVVSRQLRNQKSHGVGSTSLMWMAAADTISRWSKPDDLYHLCRKDLPLAGGSSNVDLTRTWAAKYWPTPLSRYVRISPTGPMTPLVVTTTTLGDQLDIGLTHRVGLIDTERATRAGEAFVRRLERTAR